MHIRAHSGDPALYDVLGNGMTVEQLTAWLRDAEAQMTAQRMHRAAQRRMGVRAKTRWVTAAEARQMADELDAAAAAGDAEFERRVAERIVAERLQGIYARMGGRTE